MIDMNEHNDPDWITVTVDNKIIGWWRKYRSMFEFIANGSRHFKVTTFEVEHGLKYLKDRHNIR